jgi:hypothetical protein
MISGGPYRTPGEVVPRPVEIKVKVSLFVEGGKPNMDPPKQIAQDFEKVLERGLVAAYERQSSVISRCRVLAVEVTPFERSIPSTDVQED